MVGLLKVEVVMKWAGGTGSLATAYGVWEKDGESYVYSRSITFEGAGGNKKSGEIKPDG